MPGKIEVAERFLGDHLVLMAVNPPAQNLVGRLDEARVTEQPGARFAVALHGQGAAYLATFGA